MPSSRENIIELRLKPQQPSRRSKRCEPRPEPTTRAKSDQILELDRQGISRQAIASQLGIGVASVYRVLKATRAAA
jgi:DNA invertase Pin-like site-specific DNA recombinase